MALSVRRFVVAVVNGNSGTLMRSSSSSHSVEKKRGQFFALTWKSTKERKLNETNGTEAKVEPW